MVRVVGGGERVVYGSSHALMLRFYGLRRTLKGTYVFCDVTSAPGPQGSTRRPSADALIGISLSLIIIHHPSLHWFAHLQHL